MAVVTRVDLNPTPGVFFGGSFYNGGSGQGLTFDGQELDVGTRIGELHAQIRIGGLRPEEVSMPEPPWTTWRTEPGPRIHREEFGGGDSAGGYLQFGYNLLSRVREDVRLMPYYRAETLDTQAQVPADTFVIRPRDRSFHTLVWSSSRFPISSSKPTISGTGNRAKTGLDQFNIAMGYNF